MARAFTAVGVAYVAAALVAVGTALAAGLEHPLAVAFAADLAATGVVFAFSYGFRNSSFYDPYWSLAPIAIVLYWAARAGPGVVPARQLLVVTLVVVWGLRLTANWARGWQGLGHEDWRYVELQREHGSRYWLVSFAGIHLAPTLWVFAGCLSLYPAVASGTRPLGALDLLALLLTGGAIAMEAVADQQLRRFRLANPEPAAVLASGLWRWSRHPNYCGEMGFWWGLYLFALAADPGWWWAIVGPLSITLMFLGVSLPMIERRMHARRPAFAAYVERTPLLIPWFPSR